MRSTTQTRFNKSQILPLSSTCCRDYYFLYVARGSLYTFCSNSNYYWIQRVSIYSSPIKYIIIIIYELSIKVHWLYQFKYNYGWVRPIKYCMLLKLISLYVANIQVKVEAKIERLKASLFLFYCYNEPVLNFKISQSQSGTFMVIWVKMYK